MGRGGAGMSQAGVHEAAGCMQQWHGGALRCRAQGQHVANVVGPSSQPLSPLAMHAGSPLNPVLAVTADHARMQAGTTPAGNSPPLDPCHALYQEFQGDVGAAVP